MNTQINTKGMKVLWFTNTPSNYVSINSERVKHPYNGGGWISSAEKEIKKSQNISLGVSFLYDNQPFKVFQDGVTYYPIPFNHKKRYVRKLRRKISCLTGIGVERTEESEWDYFFNKFNSVISDFQPDIIHVWGTETYMGLVSLITDIPIILHIQGLLIPYQNALFPPFFSWWDYCLSSFSPISMMRHLQEKNSWRMISHRERIIMKNVYYYLGRTSWDFRCSQVFNNNRRYFKCNEILRDVFYSNDERVVPSKLKIVSTISMQYYKGFDLILKTAKVLKDFYHVDFEWNCFGNIEEKLCEKITHISHFDVNVQLCGVADSTHLKNELRNSSLFFYPSYIDNSPNSLCEAQILGLPVIASNVGGISSLIEDNVNGFLIPANDPYQGAFLIMKLFNDTTLNITMGKKAKEIAQTRHNKQKIVDSIIDSYDYILNNK